VLIDNLGCGVAARLRTGHDPESMEGWAHGHGVLRDFASLQVVRGFDAASVVA